MHANQLLPWIARRRGMSYKWGCINTYLRNAICSTHSLACKTSSHQVVWWIYRQVDLQCLHSQCKCSLFVGDLLWNGDGHHCALFLHVESDCWLAWLHSRCHKIMALSLTWFQSHSRWPLSKEFVHNYRRIRIRLWRLIMQHYFASLMTMEQVIFPTIDKCPKWVKVTNYLKLCTFGIPQTNILCMLQVPQYSLCNLQITLVRIEILHTCSH